MEKRERSEKAQKIRKIIIGGGFDCRTDAILKLISEVIEENLGVQDNDYQGELFPPPRKGGGVFCLAGNPNAHDYSLGEPSIYLCREDRGGIALRLDGSRGNYLPDEKIYYPPTEKEFEDAIETLAELPGGMVVIP